MTAPLRATRRRRAQDPPPGARVILWSQDVYPDAAEEYGTVRRGGLASRILRAVQRWLLRRTDHVVALDESDARARSRTSSPRAPGRQRHPELGARRSVPSDASPPRWEVRGPGWVRRPVPREPRVRPLRPGRSRRRPASTPRTSFLFVGRRPVSGIAAAAPAAGPERRRPARLRPEGADAERARGRRLRADLPGRRSLGIMSPCKLHGGLALGARRVRGTRGQRGSGDPRSTRAGSRSDRGTSTG